MRQLVYLALLFFPGLASATGLVNRYQYLNAGLLPEGVWTFGVNHGQSSGKKDASFSKSGERVSNETYFSRDVSYSNLQDEINDPLEKELAAAAFSAYERQDGEIAGRATNNVEVEQSSNTYVLGRGLSKKSSLLMIFPVVTIKTRFSSRFNNSSSLNSFASQLRAEGQNQRADEILEKSQNALSNRLNENGYRSNYPTEMTTLANIYLDFRHEVKQGRKFDLTSDSFVVVPAGKKSDEDDFIYMRINEEQYSFKQALTASYQPNYSFNFLASTFFHKRFAFEKKRRIPVNNVSPLSKDIDSETRIQYGDTVGGSLQLNFSMNDTFTFYAGRSYEAKARDKIEGNTFSSERYDFIEKNTTQNIQLNYLGVAVNTIQAFLAKKFLIPVDVNLQYSYPTGGANTFDNKIIAMNMMVFYK